MLYSGANLARNLIWSEVSREVQLTINIASYIVRWTQCGTKPPIEASASCCSIPVMSPGRRRSVRATAYSGRPASPDALVRAEVHLARERRSSRPASAGASGEANPRLWQRQPGRASPDVTNEPDHSERARARRTTPTMIEEQPETVVAMVREAIEMLTAKQS